MRAQCPFEESAMRCPFGGLPWRMTRASTSSSARKVRDVGCDRRVLGCDVSAHCSFARQRKVDASISPAPFDAARSLIVGVLCGVQFARSILLHLNGSACFLQRARPPSRSKQL